ncbi:LOW QUALITY PROTEIN: hypothetical protein MKX08_002918 [Trichoderma sp. CBMAI-0020]|nr:LOW QUALITY PROTEIN: hypothetical protein MKX08_002918 [Trichoderma sp. CBMAI-0020]
MAQTVLITGASGFIAAHVVEASSEGDTAFAELVSIVPDIAAPNAFDKAVKGVDGIIHTASPFILNATDFGTELLQPAISGATGVLEAIQVYNSSISRVIITSSFASVLDPTQGQRPEYVYTEADWNPSTVEQANSSPVMAYLASKTFAERAAFDYVKEKKFNFTVTTLCPPMVYGPIAHVVSGVNALNTSAGDIYRLMNCSEKAVPNTSFWAFADVRDDLRHHPRKVLRAVKTPKGDTGAALPPIYKVDTTKAVAELGIRFRPLQETIVDMVNSLLALQR